jgi:hypothetical protein
MIPDREIWRAANLLIRKHGADAEITAARRASDMAELRDHDKKSVWLRMRRPVVEMRAAPVGRPN